MNISAINAATRVNASFKAQEAPKPIIDLEGKKDSDVVGYSTWGGNYAFPITAGQLKPQDTSINAEPAKTESTTEPDWYKDQRFFSHEWCG